MIVGIIGNIGAGKSTAAALFEKEIGGVARFEPITNNPYLDLFYEDPKRYAFPLQIYFLNHRLKAAIETKAEPEGITWLDRTVQEDRHIFAENLRRMGVLTETDWATYTGIYDTMAPHFGTPDMYVYLGGSVDTLVSRIANRGRECEKYIEREYLENLNRLYHELVVSLGEQGKIVHMVNMDEIDLSVNADAVWVTAKVREVAGAVLLMREAERHRHEQSLTLIH